MYAISICATFSLTQKWHKARPYCTYKNWNESLTDLEIEFDADQFCDMGCTRNAIDCSVVYHTKQGCWNLGAKGACYPLSLHSH